MIRKPFDQLQVLLKSILKRACFYHSFAGGGLFRRQRRGVTSFYEFCARFTHVQVLTVEPGYSENNSYSDSEDNLTTF